MKEIDESYHDVLDCYLLNEQPMTCGMCGSRTSFHEDESGKQVHVCLNTECGYRFLALDEDYMSKDQK